MIGISYSVAGMLVHQCGLGLGVRVRVQCTKNPYTVSCVAICWITEKDRESVTKLVVSTCRLNKWNGLSTTILPLGRFSSIVWSESVSHMVMWHRQKKSLAKQSSVHCHLNICFCFNYQTLGGKKERKSN